MSKKHPRTSVFGSVVDVIMGNGLYPEMTLNGHAQKGLGGIQAVVSSTGSPAAFHSGNPSSRRRALKPFCLSPATASNDRTQ